MLRLLLLCCALVAGAAATAAERVILVVGDSISAAYGVPTDKGWVKLLEPRLADQGHDGWRVVNASVSGDTSAGGLSRLPQLLRQHSPAVVVIELGGNDGLRGLPLKNTRSNLQQMVRMAKKTGARVLLLGMEIPPNYGPKYTAEFRAMYPLVARAENVALVPFVLEGIATRSGLMQSDGIHPNSLGQAPLLNNVWPALEPLLR